MHARTLITLAGAVLTLGLAHAQDNAPRQDQLEFRALYEELIETNTQVSNGSCTLAAQRTAARLKKDPAFEASALTLFSTPEHPKDGGLVAVLPGTSQTAKPILLLAHIDVVE